MRHQDIHVGGTYRVHCGLVMVDAHLGNYWDGTHHRFDGRVIAWTDFHYGQDEHLLRRFTSGEFIEPMTIAEFEARFGTREQQRIDAHLRRMPDLIRSWDDLLHFGQLGRHAV